jgi:hypothetical protein
MHQTVGLWSGSGFAAAFYLIRPQVMLGVRHQRAAVSSHLSDLEHRLREHDLYDAEIVAHGFVPYLRDYRLLVDRRSEAPLGLYEYVFSGCMEARYTVTLPPFAISMDERLVDASAEDGPDDAFHWSVGSACSAEEGVTLSASSQRAAYWTERLGRPMFEIVIGTNVFELALVFHGLAIRPTGAVDGALSPPDV